MYASGLGRFMQTDPIGYGDGLNWYGYVHADPVNSSDPLGLQQAPPPPDGGGGGGDIVVIGIRPTSGGEPQYGQQQCRAAPQQGFKAAGCGTTQAAATTGDCLFTNGTAGACSNPLPKTPPIKLPKAVKDKVCAALAAHGYDTYDAFTDLNNQRKQGQWSTNLTLRAAENWLTGAAFGHDLSGVGLSGRWMVYYHSYMKYVVSGTTAYSDVALQAGLDGYDKQDLTPAELKAWCNSK